MSLTIKEISRLNGDRLRKLASELGCRFSRWNLLQQALIHSSFAFEQGEPGADNETLEFLGDAVLDLAVGTALFRRYPEMREGELTRLRASLVNEGILAQMARRCRLGDYLYLGRGEETTGGREKPSILAGVYEALIGAVYLDRGYEPTAEFVERQFVPLFSDHRKHLLAGDPKSRLQEVLQERFNAGPEYRIEKEEGPAHDREFTASVNFQGRRLGSGRARTKKEAEQRAAAVALEEVATLLQTREESS